MFQGYNDETFEFFMAIRFNNNTDFFHSNHDWYLRGVRGPSLALAEALSPTVEAIDDSLERRPNRVVSRINRDIRYTKDKSPYRPNRWVVLYDEKYRGTEWKLHPSFYFELMPEGYTHGLGMWCATPAYLTAYRKKIDSNPAAFQRLAKKIDKDPLFHLEGEEYKKIKNESLDPLSQLWYKKKDVLMVAGGELEEIIFSPDLPQYLAEEWSRLKGMYAFLSEIEAE